MANTFFKVTPPQKRSSSTGDKCICTITAPANQKIVIRKRRVNFYGAVPATASIQIYEQIGLTGGTSDALAPQKLHDSDATSIQSTAKENYSVNPATGTGSRKLRYSAHAQGFGQSFDHVEVPAGGTWSLWINAGSAVDFDFDVECEE